MIHAALVPRMQAWDPGREKGRVGASVRNLDTLMDLGPGDIVLLGLCNDLGVIANGGRAGAAEGPNGFREAFSRLQDRCLGDLRLWDAGDVPAEAPYETFLETAAFTVEACVRARAIPIVIGGGHDCSYGNYLGLVAATKILPFHPPAVINLDAHLDVRPEPGPSSGNPFFKMLEHGLAGEDLAELGLIFYVNSPEHEAYVRARGVKVHYLQGGREQDVVTEVKAALAGFSSRRRRILATVDVDAIGAAWAPGVSAPNPWGLSADTVLQCARLFGASPAVACFDLMEFAPVHDHQGQTARLLAFLVAAFLEGVMQREL